MKENDKLRRVIHPEVKIVDAALGLVDYVASDESLDWYREVIKADGWRFTHFRKNAPFVDAHDYGTIEKLLGAVLRFEVKGSELIERTKWAIDVPGNQLAQVGWQMTVNGYLKAVSVGFRAVESVARGQTGFDDVLASVQGLSDEEGCEVRRIFTAQEQLELSACVLGANPNALVKAWEDGAVGDEQLHGLGFGSDGAMQFLCDAAAAIESGAADELMRSMIALEMQRTYAARGGGKEGSSKGQGKKAPGTPPSTRAAGEDAERRAADRAGFLRKLGELVNQ